MGIKCHPVAHCWHTPCLHQGSRGHPSPKQILLCSADLPERQPAGSCAQAVSQPGKAVSPLSLDETAFTETAQMSDISALMINRAGEDKAGADLLIFFYSSL